MKPKVIKVGGSCLSSVENSKKILDLFNSEESIILVVSAFKEVTNLIEHWYDTQERRYLSQLISLHSNFYKYLVGEDISGDMKDIFVILKDINNSTHSREHALSLGEKLSSMILLSFLRKNGIDICQSDKDPLIVGDAQSYELLASRERILTEYKKRSSQHLITQGFASTTIGGNPANLGREGSDLTAIIFAEAFKAPCFLYKDVGALYSDNPTINPKAIPIKEISFEDYKKDHYYSGIVYDKVIDFCIKYSTTIYICSIENNTIGTRIMKNYE